MKASTKAGTRAAQKRAHDERAAMARGLARLKRLQLDQAAQHSARSAIAAIRRAKQG